jgi:N-acyl-D-aspartate/D-glutamate deacylase
MPEYDLAFTGGTVVDGTGSAPITADVAIKDGQVVEVGRLNGSASRRIDATGLIVAPGVIDVHTHYDAQVCWDGLLGGSSEHGTTTVIAGNCGIGVAPTRSHDREATIQDLIAIEGMSHDVLTAGIDWQFETFAEYFAHLRKRGLGINVAAFVPLSQLRRYVMGDQSSERPANAQERLAIGEVLRDAMLGGALGFSLTTASRHIGYKGRPLACRVADRAELKHYANVLRDLGRGTIQVNPFDSVPYPKPSEIELVEMLLAESGRPLTYSAAHIRPDDPGAIVVMLEQLEPLRARGAMVQTLTRPLTSALSMRSPFIFAENPEFAMLYEQPLETQRAIYSDRAWRDRVREAFRTRRTNVADRWHDATVLRVESDSMRPLLGKSVRQIAAERNADLFDTFIDVALEDNLQMRYMVYLMNVDDAQIKKQIADPRVMIGLADGGAHVEQLCESSYPTYMLGHWVREEQAMTLERAVHRMTGEPAAFFGLRDRGVLAPGRAADVMVFDPQTVGSVRTSTEVRRDLPGGGERLYAKADGVEYVVVNGSVLYESGVHTGAMPGTTVADG